MLRIEPEDKTPLPNESEGILAVTVLGRRLDEYCWQGKGSVTVTHTSANQEYWEGEELKFRRKDVAYVTILLTLDPDAPQAVLPVRQPSKKDTQAMKTTDAWDH